MNIVGQWLSYPAAADRILSMIGIEIHWIILQYILGLTLLAVIAEAIWLRTKNEDWIKIAKTIAKGFTIAFAVGAAMGTAAEFGLILLWPNLTEAAGRYIFFPLYAEIFAFLMEVIFVYMFWYSWKKVPTKVHILIGILAIAGAWFSAAMIVSVNSYMQAPPGILPAYSLEHGWMFKEGFPKITLYVPDAIASNLNVTVLKALHVDILGKKDGSVVVAIPVLIVRQLMYEAFTGKVLGQSALYPALKASAREALKNVPVFNVVDAIVRKTIQEEGVFAVTFESPTYSASILHTLFAAITVSAFTLVGGFGLSYAFKRREHAKLGVKYGLIVALISLSIQGFVTGHDMGVAVAKWNPEKFAAMEAGTPHFLEKIVSFLAYGSFNAKIPSYSQIPNSLKPPLIIHYLYYTKIGLAIALWFITVFLVYLVYKKRELPYASLVVLPVVAQIVSFLGWAVREMGRKPWTIYGVMDVKTAHTINPPPTGDVAVIALYLVAILAALIYSSYRILWRG